VTSSVPSAQLVLTTVPAAESIVVVPAAVQLQFGEVAKFADHCVVSTFTEGGPPHAQTFGTPPPPHVSLAAQFDAPQSIVPPQPSESTPHLPAHPVATVSGSQHEPALQTWPGAQFVLQSRLPPQPFETCAPQAPEGQDVIGVQHAPALHTWLLGQLVEQSRTPPQLFGTELLQLPAGHTERGVQVQTSFTHGPEEQSVFARHALPVEHAEHGAPPPQSTSVSLPFFTLSLQVAARHVFPPRKPPWQAALWQSLAEEHALPSAHFGQPPPQSTSVSEPSLTLFEQLEGGGEQLDPFTT
jgi:hypothetical protein